MNIILFPKKNDILSGCNRANVNAIVKNLTFLISVREGDHLLLGFTSYEIAE